MRLGRRRRDGRLHLLEVGVRWPPESFVAWKLEGLVARGVRVTVASRSVFDPTFRLAGVDLVALDREPREPWRARRVAVVAGLRLALTAPRRCLRLLRGVRREVRAGTRRNHGAARLFARCAPLARLRPDVVHFEWHMVATDYLALFGVWRRPVTTSARGSDLSVYPHVPGLEPYARRLPEVLARAAAVHCVSESLGREAGAFGLDPARVRVIRPAVDPAVFHPRAGDGSRREDGAGPLRVVSVGWLRWEKGHEYALQALREAVDRGVDAHLEIVGRVPEEWERKSGERERIEHTAADLGLRDRVRLTGHLASAQVAARLCASDVLLQASVTEGLPNTIVEAMACGLPVVATRCGGIPEAVEDGVHGFLAPPRDPSGLADGLVALAADAGLRARMGAAGRERVLVGHTLDREHEAFLTMYREAAGA